MHVRQPQTAPKIPIRTQHTEIKNAQLGKERIANRIQFYILNGVGGDCILYFFVSLYLDGEGQCVVLTRFTDLIHKTKPVCPSARRSQ